LNYIQLNLFISETKMYPCKNYMHELKMARKSRRMVLDIHVTNCSNVVAESPYSKG